MSKSNAAKISISLPPELEMELKKRAKMDKNTLSGVLKEASIYYLRIKKLDDLQEKLSIKAQSLGILDDDDVDKTVHKFRK